MGVLSPGAATRSSGVPPETARRLSTSAERVFDYLLAVSVASWAVLGLTASAPPITTVRWGISLLHLSVAIAIVRRAPRREGARTRELVLSLPALVLAGLAFDLSAPLDAWPAPLEAVFVLGAGLAIWSFTALGESFAILPARRGIVSHGPYRVVRHPAYVGEVLMIVACALSRPGLAAAIVVVVVLPLVALRIHAEEDLLSHSADYQRYRDVVRSRLFPWLW